MSTEMIRLLLDLALAGQKALLQLRALKTSDPIAYEAALQDIGADHAAMLKRLEAAAAP